MYIYYTYQTIDETKLYEASYYFKKRIASFLSTRRDARGSSANISAKGFQLHLWPFSLSRFIPSYPFLFLFRALLAYTDK